MIIYVPLSRWAAARCRAKPGTCMALDDELVSKVRVMWWRRTMGWSGGGGGEWGEEGQGMGCGGWKCQWRKCQWEWAWVVAARDSKTGGRDRGKAEGTAKESHHDRHPTHARPPARPRHPPGPPPSFISARLFSQAHWSGWWILETVSSRGSRANM